MASAAATITAASAASGKRAMAGPRPSSASTTKPAATRLTSCVLLPSEAGTAVRLAPDETGKPETSELATLITPSATSSWLASTR
jgi:hypothetical protein